ncbi:MAG: hypothetical protein V1728_01170 [Candidatus Micrarchaeota archaeon]
MKVGEFLKEAAGWESIGFPYWSRGKGKILAREKLVYLFYAPQPDPNDLSKDKKFEDAEPFVAYS